MNPKQLFSKISWGVWISLLILQATVAAAATPKLVVLIVVDQMRGDTLEKFKPYFGQRGFSRLVSEGTVFTKATYDHVPTETCPGHALLGSGIYAYKSGIVANKWYSHSSQKVVYCAEDPNAPTSEEGGKPRSPILFEVKSLSQRIKEQYPKARVVGVSYKDRSSIMLVGPGADAAYWYDEKVQKFVSSSYYHYNPQVLSFNLKLGSWLNRHPVWEYSLNAPAVVCPKDKPEYHKNPPVGHPDYSGVGAAFPHPIKTIRAMHHTAWGSDLLTAFTEHVIETEDLGHNPEGNPDILALSYSNPDAVGHLFGPDSCETADTYSRLDRTLAKLLTTLEKRVGRNNLLVILSSDHGVASVPEFSQAAGLSAGRLDLEDPPKFSTIQDLSPLRLQIEQDAAQIFRYPFSTESPSSEAFIAAAQTPGFFINNSLLRKRKIPGPRARDWLKRALLKIPGIKAAYTSDEIAEGKGSRAIRYGFRKDRSADVIISLRENWIWNNSSPGGTGHSESYDYDSHVPLLIWGGG
ncbi:MAG: alkaline phosphatase family protein, partial [Elusimicrobia bacterium]|nr:alkaline phosphatase family protein [Elusimicrobiota bacterium]